MKRYTQVAIDLAYQSGKIMRDNFSLGMKKKLKKDSSPLTISDTQINSLVLSRIAQEFPNHSIISEEGSNKNDSKFVWYCDPIDGTIPFSSGIPISVFSLALTECGIPILGVVYDPFTDRLFLGEKGKGASLNKQKITVSLDASLTSQVLYMGWWKHSSFDLENIRGELSRKGCKIMDFCSFAYAGTLIAAGEFGALIYPDKFPWDTAAIQIIIEEAGGKCTDFSGKPQRYDTDLKGFIASNGIIHQELLSLVKEFVHKKKEQL